MKDLFEELHQLTLDAEGCDVALERKLALTEYLKHRFGQEEFDRIMQSIKQRGKGQKPL